MVYEQTLQKKQCEFKILILLYTIFAASVRFNPPLSLPFHNLNRLILVLHLHVCGMIFPEELMSETHNSNLYTSFLIHFMCVYLQCCALLSLAHNLLCRHINSQLNKTNSGLFHGILDIFLKIFQKYLNSLFSVHVFFWTKQS